MNFLYSSILTLVIFMFIRKITLAKEVSLDKDDFRSALAVIKKRDSTLQLGIPTRCEKGYAFYTYDDTEDEKGLKEEFLYACPPRDYIKEEYKLEKRLKKKKVVSKDSTLFITHEYKYRSNVCGAYFMQPSVKKSEKGDNGNVEYCAENNAEIYDVGYPILKPGDTEKPEIQFISMYKICHSTAKRKGTLYTIHKIKSPSSLLQPLWEFYTLDPKISFKSPLDKRNKRKKRLFKNYFTYQLVGIDDMATRPWGNTTLFLFNYIYIPKNRELLAGMFAADNYIRLFSKENNKRLTLYSGAHQAMKKTPTNVLSAMRGFKSELINLLWRIIIDDDSNAVIMITQYTLVDCYQDLICFANQVIVQKYKKGGCTYTCPVTSKVKNQLGLPRLKTKEYLALKFTQKVAIDATQTDQDGLMKSPIKPAKEFSIYEITNRKKFMEVLKDAEVEIENTTRRRFFAQGTRSRRGHCGGGGGGGGSSCFGRGGGDNAWFAFNLGIGFDFIPAF